MYNKTVPNIKQNFEAKQINIRHIFSKGRWVLLKDTDTKAQVAKVGREVYQPKIQALHNDINIGKYIAL